MRDAAYMVSWGQIVPGREKEALAQFQKGRDFWEKQEAAGNIRRVGPFFLAPGSGSPEDMGGFALYLGRLDALQAILASEEYEAIFYPTLQLINSFKHRLFLGGTEKEVMRIISGATTQWQAAGLMKA